MIQSLTLILLLLTAMGMVGCSEKSWVAEENNISGEMNSSVEINSSTASDEEKTFSLAVPEEIQVKECQAKVLQLKTEGGEGEIKFSISGDDAISFDVNSSSGEIVFKPLTLPDYERRDSYLILAEATDANGKKVTKEIVIEILQWNTTHNGITYGCVPSPYTGKVWLDRNLGAQRVCQSFDDILCYGEYYQWGRNADGHQKSDSLTTWDQAQNITTVGHSMFILADYAHRYDWAYTVDQDGSDRITQWREVDGSSVCPKDFHVATEAELKAELLDENSAEIQKSSLEKEGNSDDRRINAFNTFLKLPMAGDRHPLTGKTDNQTIKGAIWTASAHGVEAADIYITSSKAEWHTYADRAFGLSVRCVKE